MGEGRVAIAVALAGLLLAGIAAFAIGTPPLSARGEPAARSLLADWERSLRGTYAVDQDFTRTKDDGSRLVESTTLVQRPPSRLLSGLGSVSGRIGDDVVRCAAEPSGTSRCFTSPGAPPFEDDVRSQVAVLAGYVLGDRPLYRVLDFDDGCFRLDLALALPSPPYGEHALFCFDAATGAPTLTVIERPGIVERTAARSVRAAVTDADLRTVVDPGALVVAPPVTTTTTTTP